MRVVWFITRPQTHGVKCAITHNGAVLLVRHTYGNRDWNLPGGHIDDGEAADDTAAREMFEELGLTDLGLRAFGTFTEHLDHRDDTIALFTAELPRPAPAASLTLDRAELRDARWFPLSALPDAIVPHAVAIIDLLVGAPVP